MFEIIKDNIFGYQVKDKRKNVFEMWFLEKIDAEKYALKKNSELYKGGGVNGNEI